jgi:hypothetical protein
MAHVGQKKRDHSRGLPFHAAFGSGFFAEHRTRRRRAGSCGLASLARGLAILFVSRARRRRAGTDDGQTIVANRTRGCVLLRHYHADYNDTHVLVS